MKPIKASHSPRWKRALDLSCVILSAPLWLPLMLVIALCIKMVSRGPVIFRQQRVGYLGHTFPCFKFRSMKVDAETKTHDAWLEELIVKDIPMAKLDSFGDPRLIRLGKSLRVTGLDELPQIFNVIRGEMSLVGPRPCTPSEFEHYLPHQRDRVNALPGITGLWQVNGKNRRTFKEMIEMDIRYGKEMSLLLDVSILLKTVPSLVIQIIEARPRTANKHVISHQKLGKQSLAGTVD